MGQHGSKVIGSPENIIHETACAIQDEVMRQTKLFKEIAILTYEEFQFCLQQLNELSKKVIDQNGKQLLFAVKKGTDSTVLWKGTVKIACIKLDEKTKIIENHKLLSLNQFLKVFKTLECQLIAALQSSQKELRGFSNNDSSFNTRLRKTLDSESSEDSEDSKSDQSFQNTFDSYEKGNELDKNLIKEVFGTSSHSKDLSLGSPEVKELSVSMLLEQVNDLTNSLSDSADALGECCICLERTPDVMLPCTHAYCMPCIEQWNTCHKTCPFCRETLDNADDAWVISNMPASKEINDEICSELGNLASLE